MEINKIYKEIDWRSFILGTALFTFIVVAAIDYNLEFLLVFSSIGLLYIGYTAYDRIQAIMLSALATTPLFLVTISTERLGPITGDNIVIWILISFLAIGAFCGFTGSYFSLSRKKAIKQKIAMGKKKEKSKKTSTESKE